MTEYAIALGMFDSVHKGHIAVLQAAANSGYKSLAVTFDKLPQKSEKTVLCEEERRRKILNTGIDEVLILEFNRVKDLSPEEFLKLLADRRDIKKICCGFNFRFGKNAVGDTAFLKEYCSKNGIEYFEADEVKTEGKTLSTSHIKTLLKEGEIETANRLLGEPFSFTAKVIEGDKRGKTLGFPTANQVYPADKAELRFGVYHTRVDINGNTFDGVTNIGVRPTYTTDFVGAETYIIDFEGDCYNKDIKLSFIEYLREEKRFDSPSALIDEIRKNVEYVNKKRTAQ